MEDLKRTLALLFRRKGRERLTEKEFVLSASMDLRWFPPREAQRLLDVALQRGLLSLDEGGVLPTFDLQAVEVPLDFVPTPEVLKARGEDLFERLVTAIVEAVGMTRKEVVARANALRAEMSIYPEVAALLAGQELGVDVSPFRGPVEETVRRRRPSPPGE